MGYLAAQHGRFRLPKETILTIEECSFGKAFHGLLPKFTCKTLTVVPILLLQFVEVSFARLSDARCC